MFQLYRFYEQFDHSPIIQGVPVIIIFIEVFLVVLVMWEQKTVGAKKKSCEAVKYTDFH